MANRELIQALPKAELHLHLEGTVAPRELVELSKRHDRVPLTLEQAEQIYAYTDFQGFLMAFKAVTERLTTPEDFEYVTYELMRGMRARNILHAEVYVSVGVVHWRKQEFEPLFEGMERGRARGEREFGVSLYWIFDAVRHFGAEAAERVFKLAAEMRGQNVIGIGIGGDEKRGPAEPFKQAFARAKHAGLRLTAHAGENAGPESVWAALNIGAERIGHGLNAFADGELVEVLAQRQVPVEICISSNVRTGCLRSVNEHPVKRYFEEGVMVTLASDDPAMFSTTLSREFEIVQDVFAFTDEHLKELARNSFEASFLPAEKKVEFLRMVDEVSERVSR